MKDEFEDKGARPDTGLRYLIFNGIGFFCAISFLLSFSYVITDILDGVLDRTRLFFSNNPGIQPFLIFTGPVILIGGPAWIWQRFRNLIKKGRSHVE